VARAAATGVAATGVWRQPRAGGVREIEGERKEREIGGGRERSRTEKIRIWRVFL